MSDRQVSVRGIRQLARKDLSDAVKERQMHLLCGLFGLIGFLVGYGSNQNVGEGLLFFLLFLAPLAGVAFAHQSIVARRAKHEYAVLLGLPFSRGDIILGTFIGRSLLLIAGIASLYLGALIGGFFSPTSFEWDSLLAGFLFGSLTGVIFVSIALGISAWTRSTTVASGGAFGAYLLFVFQLWGLIPDAIAYLLHGFESPSSRPPGAEFFESLSPFDALGNAIEPFAEQLAVNLPLTAGEPNGAGSFYQEPWFGVLVLLCWLVLPTALGYWRFSTSDL